MYAIGGGWQRAAGFNERYDTLTNTWSSIPSPIPGQWLNPGVASRGSLVYAVGGWSGGYLDLNEAFQSTFRAFLPLGVSGQGGGGDGKGNEEKEGKGRRKSWKARKEDNR